MKKETLPRIGFAIIMIAFVYLTANLVMHNVPLNLATWSMWVVIDTCLLVSIVSAGNKRPWSMIGFETGACTITLIALAKLISGNGEWSWGNTESIAAICVLIALAVWKLTSGNGGVISITTAMYIAMYPTFVDQWHNPNGQDPWFWGACSLGCALEFIGKPKTISQAFFPGCGAVANGLAAILSARQFFM
jgi:hypothetical protein